MIDKSKAIELIKPCLPTFRACYDEALRKMNLAMEAISPLNKRTKATLLHNLVNNELNKYYPSGNVTSIDEYESLSILIKDGETGETLRIRFKKLGGNGFPSNICTGRNDLIECQGLLFPEYMDITYLDVVYEPNETWTDFKHLQVLCIQNKSISWAIQFENILSDTYESTDIKSTIEQPEIEIKIKRSDSDSQEKKAI